MRRRRVAFVAFLLTWFVFPSLASFVSLAKDGVKSIVLYSDKPGNFVAGADITMLDGAKSAKEASEMAAGGQDMLNEIAHSRKPVVAAINGACMGLGAELSLACHWRIATNSAKTVISLPEVKLGLLPGAGGTQRLPRLVGLPNALDMALTGSNVRAAKAKKIGLVDEVVDELGPGIGTQEENTMRYLRQNAVARARELAGKDSHGHHHRSAPNWDRMTRFITNTSFGRSIAFSQATSKVEKETHGNYPAPLAIIECMQEGMAKGMAAGLQKEREEFGKLVMSKESEALRSIFFATTALKKNRFGKPERECKSIGVVGAGLMGAGIADVSLTKAKAKVTMLDANKAGLMRGFNQITTSLDGLVKKRQMTAFERDTLLSNLVPSTEYSAFGTTDLVIEAVFEDLAVKHAVIRSLENVVPKHCIIATNTSALPIKDVAKGSSRPENVVGMHYFSPVEKMPLLEVITHDGTSKQAAAQAVQVGLAQGKTVIVVKDGPGFYTTRILAPFVGEAFTLLQEGVSIHHVDRVLKQFGFPVGPITLTDEVGIDVGFHIAKYLTSVWPERMASGDMRALEEFVQHGFKGRKSGKGFFLYSEEKKKPGLVAGLVRKVTGGGGKEINPGALEIIKKYSVAPKMSITDQSIALRLVSRMANEAVECLQEGILANPVDGDIGAVFGLGFPLFLGGPFRWIDRVGAKALVREMEGFAAIYGPRFTPSAMLQEYARADKKFHFHH